MCAPAAPGEYSPRSGARRMLQALAESMRPLTWRQVATIADVKISGGTFSTYKGELLKQGCVQERGDEVHLTPVGRKHTNATQRPATAASCWPTGWPSLQSVATPKTCSGTSLSASAKTGQSTA